MKVVTEKHWGYPSAKRGWYVANSGDYDIAGPFVHRHQAVAYVEARQPPVRCCGREEECEKKYRTLREIDAEVLQQIKDGIVVVSPEDKRTIG